MCICYSVIKHYKPPLNSNNLLFFSHEEVTTYFTPLKCITDRVSAFFIYSGDRFVAGGICGDAQSRSIPQRHVRFCTKHLRTRTRTRTRKRTCTRGCRRGHTNAHIYAHAHAHAHTRTHMHAHTRTHTHARKCLNSCADIIIINTHKQTYTTKSNKKITTSASPSQAAHTHKRGIAALPLLSDDLFAAFLRVLV